MINRVKELFGITERASQTRALASGRLITSIEPTYVREAPLANLGAASPASTPEESPSGFGGASPMPTPEESLAGFGAASPVSADEEQPVSIAGSGRLADAFATLLAAERGDPLSPSLEPSHAAFELDEVAIERIAERVAERLAHGAFGDAVSRVVADVSERLVREEIARIRAAAQNLPQ